MDLLVFITLIVTGLGAVDDPFAASMLRPPWALAARAARLVPDRRVRASRTLAFLAARTRHVDAAVTAALDDGFGQVLTVGAGYDSRPWRLARPGVRFVELDHPGTQADKRHRAPSGPGPAYAPVDVVTEPIGPAITSAGWDVDAPGIVVVEGVTMYLERAAVAALLTASSETSAPGGRLVVNFGVGFSAHGATPGETMARRALALGREPFRCEFGADEAPGFLTDAGWQPDEVLTGPEAAARHLTGTDMATDGVGVRSVIVTAHRS